MFVAVLFSNPFIFNIVLDFVRPGSAQDCVHAVLIGQAFERNQKNSLVGPDFLLEGPPGDFMPMRLSLA